MDTACNPPTSGLTFVLGCMCSGSGCAGHVAIGSDFAMPQRSCGTCAARATVAWGGAWLNETYSCDLHSPVGMYPPGTQLPAGFWMRSILPLTGAAPYSTGHLGVSYSVPFRVEHG